MSFSSEKTFTSEKSSATATETFDMENTIVARVSFSEDVPGQSSLRQHPNGCLCALCNDARREEEEKKKKADNNNSSRPAPLFNVTKGWQAKNTKPCPAPECGTLTQKVHGSRAVRCPECGHEFCWTCLEASGKHQKRCVVKRAKLGLRRLVSDAMSGYALPPHLWRDFNGLFLDM
ncbi:hypothetical protein F5Y01DRAFT_310021 [Xylaria sp. FL0043]|nr:hypothetical protein F5Y01DRAFT_310021 [Xylaria sp. FL0043]